MIRKREPDFGISGQKLINGIVYDGFIMHGLFSVQIPCKIVPSLYTKREHFMNPSSEDFHEMLFFCKIFCNILLIYSIK